jgi:hypothetical protein
MTLGEFGSQCVLVRVAVTKPSATLDASIIAPYDGASEGMRRGLP